MEQRPVFGIFKLKWWGQKPVSADGSDLSASTDTGIRKPFGNVSLEDADDEDTIRVSIMGVLDEVPRFNQAQNEARLQRVLEVATNDLLRDKVLIPNQDPTSALEEISRINAMDDTARLVKELEKYSVFSPTDEPQGFGAPNLLSADELKVRIVAAISAQLRTRVEGVDGSANAAFQGVAGPLTGVRIGAMGKVTAISAAELATTTADD